MCGPLAAPITVARHGALPSDTDTGHLVLSHVLWSAQLALFGSFISSFFTVSSLLRVIVKCNSFLLKNECTTDLTVLPLDLCNLQMKQSGAVATFGAITCAWEDVSLGLPTFQGRSRGESTKFILCRSLWLLSFRVNYENLKSFKFNDSAEV